MLQNNNIWIGLKDDGSNTNHRWLDGTAVADGTMWHPGQPDKTYEQCGMFEPDTNLITDGWCPYKHSFICEVEPGR